LSINLKLSWAVPYYEFYTVFLVFSWITFCVATYSYSLPSTIIRLLPIPVAARGKAWVCGRWLPGIVDSNPGGGMDVCLLWVLRVVR
jgi:hypothetical protein